MKWLCKHCGMITDNPDITAHLDKDKEYREIGKKLQAECPSPERHWSRLSLELYGSIYKDKYNHSITCPVCLNETRFWRDKPFPTDEPTLSPTLRMTLTPGTRFGEMLGAEIDKAEKLGCRVKGIQLPYLAEFNGIPITYY